MTRTHFEFYFKNPNPTLLFRRVGSDAHGSSKNCHSYVYEFFLYGLRLSSIHFVLSLDFHLWLSLCWSALAIIIYPLWLLLLFVFLWWIFLCLGLDYSWCTTALWFWGRRVETNLTETHFTPACAQVRALTGILSVSCAHGRKYYYKML